MKVDTWQGHAPQHGLRILYAGRRYWGACICGWLTPEYPGPWPMPVQLAFGRHLINMQRKAAA